MGVENNCRYDSSNLFIIIVYHYFDESLIDTLVEHVPINVGVKSDYLYYLYGFFNLVLNRRLFLIPLILSTSCFFFFFFFFVFFFVFFCGA